MAKRDNDIARLSTANTHLGSAMRNYEAADRAAARGNERAADKLRSGAAIYENLAGRAIDAAHDSIVGKKK